ncbi:MAG: sugar ABC transporter permease [Caldilineaceae bacterium]|nr:sugar ABC transporter permease [Caldilineaceae bacterium]
MQTASTQAPGAKAAVEEKRRRKSTLTRRRILRDWAFISPQLVLFVLLTIVPFFVAIPILFTDMAQFNDPRINPVGLRNFTALFTDASVQADYLPALRRTLVFVLLNYTTVFILASFWPY